MVKVSIIIPIYNSEKYLESCLKSVKNQTFKEIEVIMINDGSTDESINICKSFCDKDRRFRLLNKENTGVSDCRNIGIKLAKADYIMFVDADDWLENNAVDVSYNNIKEANADLCQFNYYFAISENNYIQNTHYYKPKEIFEEKEMDILKCTVLSPDFEEKQTNRKIGKIKACWGKIYLRKMLIENKIEFNTSLKIHEDTLFNLQTFQKSKKIIFIDEFLYYYRKNESSITNRYCPGKIKENQLVIDKINNVLNEDNKIVQKAKNYLFFELFCNYIIKDVFNCKNKKKYNIKEKEIKDNIIRYQYDKIMNEINIKYLNIKHKVAYLLIKFRQYKILYLLVKLKEK